MAHNHDPYDEPCGESCPEWLRKRLAQVSREERERAGAARDARPLTPVSLAPVVVGGGFGSGSSELMGRDRPR